MFIFLLKTRTFICFYKFFVGKIKFKPNKFVVLKSPPNVFCFCFFSTPSALLKVNHLRIYFKVRKTFKNTILKTCSTLKTRSYIKIWSQLIFLCILIILIKLQYILPKCSSYLTLTFLAVQGKCFLHFSPPWINRLALGVCFKYTAYCSVYTFVIKIAPTLFF